LSHASRVAILHGFGKDSEVAFVKIGDEFGPRLEAAFAGHGELRVGELQWARRGAAIGADGLDAPERVRIAVARRAEQILGELVLLFEIGHGRPPSLHARVRTGAEERSV